MFIFGAQNSCIHSPVLFYFLDSISLGEDSEDVWLIDLRGQNGGDGGKGMKGGDGAMGKSGEEGCNGPDLDSLDGEKGFFKFFSFFYLVVLTLPCRRKGGKRRKGRKWWRWWRWGKWGGPIHKNQEARAVNVIRVRSSRRIRREGRAWGTERRTRSGRVTRHGAYTQKSLFFYWFFFCFY